MNKTKLIIKYILLVMSCFILTANNINAKTINGLTIFKIDLLQLTQASASLFDSEWLTGVVFEDINNNAIQDNNEPGIAGVRLFTVTGIQIQTDGNGRFHIPLDYSKSSKAKKILIKLDSSSLPTGYIVSSENPLLRTLGFSTPLLINFAVVKK